jgi:branched-chain amino acid transport system substrate-binding protein
MNVMGHDQLDPKEADYTTIITKIKGLNPDAIYYGGVAQAGVKVAKQLYDIFPRSSNAAATAWWTVASSGRRLPGHRGWHVTQASPHVMDDAAMADWVARYTKEFNMTPSDYAITAHDAVAVIVDSINRVPASVAGQSRHGARCHAEHEDRYAAGPGLVDENGDLVNKVISVFQIHHDASAAEDDVQHQYKYIGVAPESPAS